MERELFVLYLAWFGDGLYKVGISAERRGAGRLCEQAALSYCLVARGPFSSVRQAEVLLSSLGVAPERITSRSKQAAWWQIPSADERAAQLIRLHAVATDAIRTVPGVALLEFQAVDLISLFGLNRELASRYEMVTTVRSGTTLSGRVSHVIGRSLVLGSFPIVVDSRLLEGWTLRRSDQPSHGFDAETRSREADAHAVQGTLF
jgi:hypothetical protein